MLPELKSYGNVIMTDDQLSELGVQLKIYKDYAYYYHEGELGVRALEAWKYYYGELPMPITKGSSKWVDRSVWESVNGSLQELISVFTSGEDAVRFTPRSNQDALAAEAATKMVNKVLLVENNGYRAFHDSFKEACIVRNSWIKRYWKEGTETVTEDFEDIQRDAIDVYLNDLEGELVALSVEENEETGLCSGAITYEKHYEGVKVEYVPFEQVIIEPTATCIADTNYLAHRVRKTKDELLELGFCPEVVEGLQSNTPTIESGVITSARVDNLNPVTITSTVSVGDERTDHVWLYENYIKTSVLSGTVELLQVFTVNEQILEVNRVNDIPFETFSPFPIPGAVFGESVTDITKDIQELNTALVRGIIDNTMNANFGRYLALKGAYDRRSLLDNRPGGVVEITTPGAITPYPYHPLPQGNMALLEYVEQKKEQRTGVTRLGMGLDPNVLKNDNAFATVNTMMTAAQNRMRMIARNIAEEGMKSLMLSIYRLIRENGKMPIQVETAQGQVVIQPAMLPPRENMIVAVAIGTNERQERAQALTSALQVFTGSPALQQFMQPQNAYYLGTQLLEAMGIYDVQNYITPLDQIPPPQPNPADQLQLQGLTEGIKKTQAETQKVLTEITEVQQRLQFEQVKTADDFTMRREESLSKQDEAADKMAIEERKLQLEAMKLQLEKEKIELKRQEIMIEAQLENRQQRPVGLGGN